jgi:hypothetical protein
MTSGYGYVPRHGGAIRFDGSNDFISTNYRPAFTNTSRHYFEFNVFAIVGTTVYLCGQIEDGNNNWYFRLNDVGTIGADFVVGGVLKRVISSDAITTGWHTLGFLKNGGTLSLYINGNEVAGYSTQNTYDLGDKTFATDVLLFQRGNSSGYWNGLAAWTTLYNDTLSDARIAANYRLGPHMDGLRGIPSGYNLTVYNPADSVPAAPTGSAFALANATHVVPLRLRRELSPAKITRPVVVLNIGKEMKAQPSLYAGIDATGSNIAVSNSAGQEIPISVSGFSKADTTGAIWARVPTADSTADSMLYLNIGASLTRTKADSTTYDSCWGGTIDYISFHHLDGAGNPVDATGHYLGTVSGALDSATGQIKYGYEFDGNNDYISMGNINGIDSVQQFTLYTWIKNDVANQQDELFVQSESGSNQVLVRTFTDGHLYGSVYLNTATGWARTNSWATYISTGQLGTFSIVFDGTLAGNARLLHYMNATTTSMTYNATPPEYTPDMGSSVGYFGFTSNSWDGTIDEPRLLSGALTATDIGLIYNNEDTYDANAGWDVGSYQAVNTLTWTGAVSTAWGTAGNWDGNRAPVNTDTVVIPTGASNECHAVSDTVAGIRISGSVLDVSGDTLWIQGNFIGSGGNVAKNAASMFWLMSGNAHVFQAIEGDTMPYIKTEGVVSWQ